MAKPKRKPKSKPKSRPKSEAKKPPSTVVPRKWGQLIAKVWDEPGLKERLLADPATVLKEHGLEVPRGRQVRVVENTADVFYLTLPTKPQFEELLDTVVKPKPGTLARPPASLPCPWPLCIRCL